MSDDGQTGCVWCLFADPEVAVYVSDDLATFIATLHERTCQGRSFPGCRICLPNPMPYGNTGVHWLTDIAAWPATFPANAYVYDLRASTAAQGLRARWPNRPPPSLLAPARICSRRSLLRRLLSPRSGNHSPAERGAAVSWKCDSFARTANKRGWIP